MQRRVRCRRRNDRSRGFASSIPPLSMPAEKVLILRRMRAQAENIKKNPSTSTPTLQHTTRASIPPPGQQPATKLTCWEGHPQQ